MARISGNASAGGSVSKIIIWVIVGSLVVLFVMNPDGFKSGVASIFGGVRGQSQVFTGSGYVKAR